MKLMNLQHKNEFKKGDVKMEYWSVSIKQLKEWMEMIENNDIRSVKDQLQDILEICELAEKVYEELQ